MNAADPRGHARGHRAGLGSVRRAVRLRGLLDDTMDPLHARNVGGIIQCGGTILGSARSPEFPRGSRPLRRSATCARGIEALVVIGGNGSQTGATVLSAGLPGRRRRLHHRQRPSRLRHYHRRRHRGQRHPGSHRSAAHHRLVPPARLSRRDHGPRLRLFRGDDRYRGRRRSHRRPPSSESSRRRSRTACAPPIGAARPTRSWSWPRREARRGSADDGTSPTTAERSASTCGRRRSVTSCAGRPPRRPHARDAPWRRGRRPLARGMPAYSWA